MKNRMLFAIPFALSLIISIGVIGVQTVFASYILGINDLKNHGGWNFQSFNLDNNTMTGLNYTGDSFEEMESLTYGGGNTYYGIESFNSTGKDSTLYSFEWDGGDTVTGEAAGKPFDASNIDAATFVDGLLYAFDNNTDMLTTVNLNGEKTGGNKVTGFDHKTKFEGLAYGSGGLLYASATKGGNSWLYSMNLGGDGDIIVANEVGKIKLGGKSFGQVEALTFLDDVLYGVGNKGNNPLIQIDTGTGKVFGTPVNWGTGDVEGIAAGGGSSAVPEPATLLLLGFGLLGFARSGIKKFTGKWRNGDQ